MGTFCWRVQLSRFGDLDRLLRLVSGRLGYVLHLLNDIIAFQDLSEYNMLSIQPAAYRSLAMFHIFDKNHSRGDCSCDEELRAIGVLARIRHTEHTSLTVLQLEVLIRELLAINRFPTGA